MQTFSQTTLLGRLGTPVDLRKTKNGVSYCSLSLATDRPIKDSAGNWTKETEWHRCSVWGATAEYIADNAMVGDMIFVNGENQTRSYEKDGVKHYVTEIKVKTLSHSKGSRPDADMPTKPAQAPAASQAAQTELSDDFDDDDLPF